jgi:uncharacterized protein DUF4154
MALLTVSRRLRRWRGLALILVGATLAFTLPRAPQPLEYRVKAAYLLNFTRYVEWPPTAFATPQAPIVLCTLGQDPFGEQLEQTVAGRTSQGRPIALRQVDGATTARGCHVVFLTYEEWRRRPDVLPALRGRGALVVGETQEFVADGGMISFVTVDQTIRFAVNLSAAGAEGLRVSSRMLALAMTVYGHAEATTP